MWRHDTLTGLRTSEATLIDSLLPVHLAFLRTLFDTQLRLFNAMAGFRR